METQKIAPHEAYELHELLTFKNICATKSDAMSKIVKDDRLRMLLEEDFSLGIDHIRELQSLLKLSEFTEKDEAADENAPESEHDTRDTGLTQ